jgi:hypothetical protein
VQEEPRRGRNVLAVEITALTWVDECMREMPALELALLRRGVEDRDSVHVRCGLCRRTPLTGERVYLAESGPVLCELCRSEEPATEVQCRVVRGPSFGRAIRIIDQRAG